MAKFHIGWWNPSCAVVCVFKFHKIGGYNWKKLVPEIVVNSAFISHNYWSNNNGLRESSWKKKDQNSGNKSNVSLKYLLRTGEKDVYIIQDMLIK